MKRMSWPCAPSVKPASSGGKSDSPTVTTVDLDVGERGGRRPRRSAAPPRWSCPSRWPRTWRRGPATPARRPPRPRCCGGRSRASFGAARYSTSTDSPGDQPVGVALRAARRRRRSGHPRRRSPASRRPRSASTCQSRSSVAARSSASAPPSTARQPHARLEATAELEAGDEHDDQRQDQDEEEAEPVAQEANEVRARDRRAACPRLIAPPPACARGPGRCRR